MATVAPLSVPLDGSAKKKAKAPARTKPQGGSAKKKKKKTPAAPSKSGLVNEILEKEGFKCQFGLTCFKAIWKKQVDASRQQDGAWKAEQVGSEWHYKFSKDDSSPAIVSCEKATKYQNHVLAVARKLNFTHTNGKQLFRTAS